MLRRNQLLELDMMDCLSEFLPTNTPRRSFTGFTSNAAACELGNLFFAIDSCAGDGHDDIELAAAKGATGIVAERILPTDIPTFIVPDSRLAYAKTAHHSIGSPTNNLRMIGISGTCGKTAATFLIQKVFQYLGKKTGALSDLYFDNGTDIADFPENRPDSKVYANWLRAMVTNDCQ